MTENLSLPRWADPRLVVRVEGYGDERFVVNGNPHTNRGLVSVFSVKDQISLSVRPRRMIVSTDYAAGWLAGYLSGDEPAPPKSTALTDYGQWTRQRDYFHTAQHELSIQRRGLYSVNACLLGSDSCSFQEAVELIANFFGLLASESIFWATVTWVPEDAEMAKGIAIETSEDLRTIIWRLNAPTAIEPEYGGEIVVHLVNTEAINQVGVVEVAISIETFDSMLSIASITINIERPEDLIDSAPLDGTSSSEDALRYILKCAVDAMNPDIASVSAKTALRDSEAILVSVDGGDDVAAGIPGWLTYLSPRVTPQFMARLVTPDFRIVEDERGTLIEFTGGLSQFGVDEANRLVAATLRHNSP